jgi:Ankyrin repeats (many copies)
MLPLLCPHHSQKKSIGARETKIGPTGLKIYGRMSDISSATTYPTIFTSQQQPHHPTLQHTLQFTPCAWVVCIESSYKSSSVVGSLPSSFMAQSRVFPSLEELCFDTIIENLDMYSNINEILPIELKERIFSHYTSKITPVPSASSFPIASYPEDRYRDVQLVNRITCQRVIPLCFAMWSSLDYRFEKVKRLIEEEACDVNESDLEGFCPLHYAAIYGRIEACKLLLSHGADCTRKNNFGKTPADLAQDGRVQQMIKCMHFCSPSSTPPHHSIIFLPSLKIILRNVTAWFR